MTFVGIRARRNTAEIVVDSAAYLARGTRFVQRTKVRTFPHIDAAFVCSGHGPFSFHAHTAADEASSMEPSFDAMLDAMPHWLEAALKVADNRDTDPSEDQVSGVAFLVGYSIREGGYVAVSASMDDLEPRPLDDVHVQPSPFSRRPSQRESDEIRKELEKDEDLDGIAELFKKWNGNPPPVVNSDIDWIKLAQASRAQRSLAGDFLRVWVAGSLNITRLKPGSIRSNRLHTFNDTGEELRKLLTDSRHPVAQVSPCHCESGKAALDCCLVEEFDDPCGCRSGKAFGDCCVVTDRDAVPERLWSP